MDNTASNNAITIYTTTFCAFCATEKQWLDRLNVSYNVKNIEEDESAREELLAKLDGNFQGVPVTDIAGDIILGFDRPKLQASLETHKLIAT